MTLTQAVLLGILEGFTEFLPISSTAHLLLAQRLMGIVVDDATVTFTIGIQFGSICAAAILYWKYFLDYKNTRDVLLALVPTLIAGVFIHPYIKLLFQSVLYIVPWTLIIGGVVMLLGEKWYCRHGNKGRDVTFADKMMLGFSQVLAMVPGVSRSGAMIVTGLFAKLDRKAITSFTFVLAIPTMMSATLYDVYKSHLSFNAIFSDTFIIGFVTACIVAFASIRTMLFLVNKYTFTPFAWYRIILGSLIAVFVYF